MESIFSKGMYTVQDASRLTNIPTTSFRSWISSYKRYKKLHTTSTRHFWNPDFIESYDAIILTFKDMMEARFVHMFRKHKISFNKISSAATYLSKELNTMSPFSYRKFETDGISILVYNSENKTRLDTFKNQYYIPDLDILMKEEQIEAIKTDVGPLIDGIQYNEQGAPQSWRPRPTEFPQIILNPEIHTGNPTIDGVNVHTIFLQYEIENSFKEVSRLYKIKEEYVRQAYNFYREVMQ